MNWNNAIKEIEKHLNEYRRVHVMYHEKRHKKRFVMPVEFLFTYEDGAGLATAVQLAGGIINKNAFVIDEVYRG